MRRTSIGTRSWIAAALLATALMGCAKSDPTLPEVTVHKSASCGCCKLWVQHLRNAGFDVVVRNTDDLNPLKERLGVPAATRSCHTAEVAGYFIEGHVPVEDIDRLLRERPSAKGLAVPGMPAGSPGMEVSSGRIDPYEVLLISSDGDTAVFARRGQGAAQRK